MNESEEEGKGREREREAEEEESHRCGLLEKDPTRGPGIFLRKEPRRWWPVFHPCPSFRLSREHPVSYLSRK